MDLPKYHETFIPILKILNDGKAIHINELRKRVRDQFYSNLSQELLTLKTKSGDVLILNRIAWGKAYLKQAKMVKQPERGIVQITEKGTSALKKEKLTFSDITNDPDFQAYRKAGKEEKVKKYEDKREIKLPNFRRNPDINYERLLKRIKLDKNFSTNFHSLGDPQRMKISKIIDRCNEGKWVVPHFQRYFDWNRANIKDLLESIFNDYYIGSFLLWETNRNPFVGITSINGVLIYENELKPDMIILDGQQRITSLYYAIKSPIRKIEDDSEKGFAIKGSNKPLYFYINFYKYFKKGYQNEIIEIFDKKLSEEETFKKMLFPIYILENYDEWVKKFKNYLKSKIEEENLKPKDELLDKIDKIRDAIQDKLKHIWNGFEIPYVSIPRTMSLSNVSDIFENINTKGKTLNVFDLLIARLYKYNIKLKNIWDDTKKKYQDIKKYYDKIDKMPIYIFQAISLLYEKNSSCKRSDILNIYKNIYKKKERKFNEDWKEISECMDKTIKKLENMRDGFGVKDEKFIPFAPMIPVLCALLKKIEDKKDKASCLKKIKKWYWLSIFTNAYSASADSRMTSDFKDITKWFNNDSEEPKNIEQMRKEISLLDLRNIQTQSSSQYRGVMSLIALDGAMDFDTSEKLENARENDRDHIFPKDSYGSEKHINSILNITWMSKETNRNVKRNKKPSKYINEFIKNKYNSENEFINVLKTHFVNEKTFDFLKNNEFDKFIEERNKEILKKIGKLTGTKFDKKISSLIESGNPFGNRFVFINCLKSCDEYIYWLDKYFNKKGLEFLHEIIKENKDNIKEVRIIASSKSNYINKEFRSLFIDFKKSMNSLNINCELRVINSKKIEKLDHDRFIISKYNAYNVPSLDTVLRGQLSEISLSNNREILKKIFEDMWKETIDIISDWENIKNRIR